MEQSTAIFNTDATVLGLLLVVLALIFVTSNSEHPVLKKFYGVVPPLLLCYFVPALLNSPLNIIDIDSLNLYPIARDYLLPSSLVLLCLGIDFKGLMILGPKALIMFFAGTIGVILGGPVALFIVSNFFPGLINVASDDLWKGLSTICGAWIGGGANQAAMREIFNVDQNIFASMVVVDVVVAYVWMGVLLYGVNMSDKIDRFFKGDNTSVLKVKKNIEDYSASIARNPTTTDYLVILAIAFGSVGLAYFFTSFIMPIMKTNSDLLQRFNLTALDSNFFWLVIIATAIGIMLSFTKLRNYEGAGASKIGGAFIYILVATIGMQMNIQEVFSNLGLFAVGVIWMTVHALALFITARIIKAPYFFFAVGSMGNIGGAASAPVIASAFSPSLAPVGVLLAVLSYAVGTYGAILCAFLMEWVYNLS